MTQHKNYTAPLELPQVLEQLAGLCRCAGSRALALALTPQYNPRDVQLSQSQTAAAYQMGVRYGNPGMTSVSDPTASLKRAAMGSSLSLRELLEVRSVLQALGHMNAYFKQIENGADSPIAYLFEQITPDKRAEDRLSMAILSEDELDDNASPTLYNIRTKIRQQSLGIRSKLDSMIKSTTFQKYLQEPIVTLRDNRFVLPVKAEHRNEVPGLVHDTSASGATFFIEPMAVVEAGNAIRVLMSEEEEEERRIIAELSAMVGERADMILAGYRAAVEIDLLFAKVRLGERMNAMLPHLSQDGHTRLIRARHPLIPRETAVPIDIEIGGDYDTLVITGPNTGGKTVAIKTLGLLCLMAQCGLMIPAADGSRVSVYHEVLADIGDEQSIEQSLSTFSGHMHNILGILERAGQHCLVLLDELGAGTDPVEGAALAIAIIERLRRQGAYVVATTHYAELKIYALETQGIENASCEFDIENLRPTYRLITGVPGRSNAFLISEKLGLPADIIERAKTYVPSESHRFERVVEELEATRQALEQERAEAQSARRRIEQIEKLTRSQQSQIERDKQKERERAKAESAKLVKDIQQQAADLMAELEALKKQRDSEQFGSLYAEARGRLRKGLGRLEEMVAAADTPAGEDYVLPRPLKKGDYVRLRSGGQTGQVTAVEGDHVRVQMGSVTMNLSSSALMLSGPPEKEQPKTRKRAGKGVTFTGTSKANRDASQEVMLRGMDTTEAMMELDAAIDNAVMAGVETLRIIHGKGSGILRKAVAERLRRHPSIREFRLGVYGEGEHGVTIATLK
jgi:DNA mismatch repair protein MutS2